MGVPTFVVGTGRCGSTMLSNMIREHPKLLSLSEFYSWVTDGLRTDEPFMPQPIDGRRFWATVAAVTPMISLGLRHSVEPPEVIYPCDAPTTRFSRQSGVPAILATALPHLTDDHDRLFEALEVEVMEWPIAAPGVHYSRLFEWLSHRFGKEQWIERSGGSLGMVGKLLGVFPHARFIHIARDGRDTALSSQAHPGFRLALAMILLRRALGADPFVSQRFTDLDGLSEDLVRFLPEQFNAEAFRAFQPSLPLCGEIWAQQIVDGMKVLADVPTDRLLTLRYEDVVADPKPQLDALSAYLGDEFIDEDWSARCAATVRKPRSTWRDLSEDEARALTEACRPGFERLRQVHVAYEF